jgi:hypothetical protein
LLARPNAEPPWALSAGAAEGYPSSDFLGCGHAVVVIKCWVE